MDQKNMKDLDILLKEIKDSYKELKNCELDPIKMTIIWSIKPKCEEAIKIIDDTYKRSDLAMKRKQVSDIKQCIQKLEIQINEKQQQNSQIGNGGRSIRASRSFELKDNNNFGVNQYAIQNEATPQENHGIPPRRDTVRILKSIAVQEIQSVNLKISKEQLDQVLKRMEENQEVINDINDMIKEHGNNLDKVEQSIQKTYENVKESNQLLLEGQSHQKKFLGLHKVRGAFQKTTSSLWNWVSWPWKTIFGSKQKKNKESANLNKGGQNFQE